MTDNDQKRIFSTNLNRLLSQTNKTQKEVADAIGVSPQTFNTWCQAIALPRMGKVQKLADYFDVSKSELIDKKNIESTLLTQSKGYKIPVLGHVAAGIPIEACEDIIDFEEIDIKLASTGTYFGLRIKGDSMEPRIQEGDVVIVKQQNDADTGDVVIVTINGHEATCKRLRKYRDGVELIPINPKYEPSFFGNDDIEKLPVKVIGRVVELRGKF